MKTKTVKIIYWSITILLALMMLMDGAAGALRVTDAKEALANLGYPEYVATITGIAKILGAIAILQPIFRTLKEWAYAGFVFIFISASASHAFVGSSFGFIILPLVMLAFFFLSYYLWKKIELEKI
jgi:uncharacterized membrane protein YphA (DoxX/SURF4 family)